MPASFTIPCVARAAVPLRCAGVFLFSIACAATATAQSTEVVSVNSNGEQCPGGGGPFGPLLNSIRPVISGDGRFVAFESRGTCFVPNDTNGLQDVFVRDRLLGLTTRVSVATDGTQANANCWSPAMSADGRFVAFSSDASTLVPGDTNFNSDVFVHDRETGVTERVNLGPGGVQQEPGTMNGSFHPSVSADGRYVVFRSRASNLVDPPATNGLMDVYLRDRETGVTEKISVAMDGAEGNGDSHTPINNGTGAIVSADGRYVVFESEAANLVRGDTNGVSDVFVRDRLLGVTARVSVSSSGAQANGFSAAARMTPDGRFITFTSEASNLVPGDTNGFADIFVHDRLSGGGVTERVSVNSAGEQLNHASSISSISDDGRVVSFDSSASNIIEGVNPNPIDVFVHDRQTAATELMSIALTGSNGNGGSQFSAISGDGRYIAFESKATNLILNDTNGNTSDIFVRDRRTEPDAPPCPADLTGSGSVGVPDLLTLLSCWGAVIPGAGCEAADLTVSGAVGVPDLLALLSQWGACPR